MCLFLNPLNIKELAQKKIKNKEMDEFYVATLCAVSMLVLCVTFYVKLFQNPGNKRPRSPPGPLGLPVVGYWPFLTDSMLHDFELLERKYGRIYKLQIGLKRHTIISSHSLAKEVLSEHDAVFANRVTPISLFVGTSGGSDVAWSPLNHEWRTMRRIFAQELAGSRSLDGSHHRRREEVRKLIKRLRDDMIGKPTPVHEVCFAAVISALSSMCWGATVAGELGERVAAETSVAVANFMDMLGKPNVSDYFPFLAWLDIQRVKRGTESRTESLHRILDAVIAEHKKKLVGDDEIKKEKGDFVQILQEISENEDGAGTLGINQKQLKGILMVTFFN